MVVQIVLVLIILAVFFFGIMSFTDAFDEFFEEREDKQENIVTGDKPLLTDSVCDLRITVGAEWDLDRQNRFSNLNPFPSGEFWYTGAWTTTGNERIVTYDWFNCKELAQASLLDLFPNFSTDNLQKLVFAFSLPGDAKFILTGENLESGRDMINRNDEIQFEEEIFADFEILQLPNEEKVRFVIRGVKDANYQLDIKVEDRPINNMPSGSPISVIICADGVSVELENQTFKDVWLSSPTLGDFVLFPTDVNIPVAVGCKN